MRKILVTVILSTGLFFPAVAQENHNFEIAKNLDIFNQLYKKLDTYYVDTLDANKQVKSAIDYMLSELDPYTVYYPESDSKELRQLTTGKYEGIGSVVRYYKKADRVVIAEPLENSPAALSGLHAGDIIMAIDGKAIPVKGDSATEDYVTNVTNKIKGEPGTTLLLTVLRPGEKKTRTFSIARKTIDTPAITLSTLIGNDVGFIQFDQFTENGARDLRRAVVELKKEGAKYIILDLRNNLGGLLSEAVSSVNLFIPKGKEVLSTRGKIKEAQSTYNTQNEPFDTEIPLVVLVNGNTASAAEITSGALQDYDRAVIIGQRTYGKGLVQQPLELPYGGYIKLTTSKYYIPSGRCVQKYDFKHRNPDGSATELPDSLAKVFHTADGRPVKDNGGITPDITIAEDTLPTMLAYLTVSDALFDYVNQYYNEHAKIAPAKDFTITDEDFAKFKAFMLKSDFTYDRQSKKTLDLLRQIAKVEGYAKDAAPEFNALEAKLTHDESYDLDRWKPDIMRIINAEIVRHYYYKKGVAENALRNDKTVKEATNILYNSSKYKQILSGK